MHGREEARKGGSKEGRKQGREGDGQEEERMERKREGWEGREKEREICIIVSKHPGSRQGGWKTIFVHSGITVGLLWFVM